MTAQIQPLTLTPPAPVAHSAAQQANQKLEAAFLEQMLKYMGPQARQGAGSGGEGEAQFQSFLSQEYARILSERIDLRLTREER